MAKYLKELPNDYFPSDGLAYGHKKVLFKGRQVFEDIGSPIYR